MSGDRRSDRSCWRRCWWARKCELHARSARKRDREQLAVVARRIRVLYVIGYRICEEGFRRKPDRIPCIEWDVISDTTLKPRDKLGKVWNDVLLIDGILNGLAMCIPWVMDRSR